MNIDRAVFVFTGVAVLASLALGLWWSPLWFWLTAFIALNQLAAGLLGTCLSAAVFKAVGLKPGRALS
jgi:hypothetical protein